MDQIELKLENILVASQYQGLIKRGLTTLILKDVQEKRDWLVVGLNLDEKEFVIEIKHPSKNIKRTVRLNSLRLGKQAFKQDKTKKSLKEGEATTEPQAVPQ